MELQRSQVGTKNGVVASVLVNKDMIMWTKLKTLTWITKQVIVIGG